MNGTLTAIWKNQMGIIQGVFRQQAVYLEKGFWKPEEERWETDGWKALEFLRNFARGPSSGGVIIQLLCGDILRCEPLVLIPSPVGSHLFERGKPYSDRNFLS